MVDERAEEIGHTDIHVIEIAYQLAKTQNEENAREILSAVPPSLLPELAQHMRAHMNLFTPAIHDMVESAPVAHKMTKAEALFTVM
jgi:hypothetical protein